MMSHDALFQRIEQLVMLHSPAGDEREVDAYLLARLNEAGVEASQDEAGNIVAYLPGRSGGRTLAITAHKDEIGMIVKSVEDDGRVQVRKLGGAFPWVYGEGVVDLLGDREIVSGILSFGSRHVSHESPQKQFQNDAPLKWEDCWVETRLDAPTLAAAGVRPGSRAVVGRHRKRPFRLGPDWVASYTLDNKASLAVLLALVERRPTPVHSLYLVASAKEEVGCLGAMHFTARHRIDELIALEVGPVSREYPIALDARPVLLSQDGYGLYDEGLNSRLIAAARSRDIAVQQAVISGFGSDGSLVMKNGHVPQAACLCFATENTHGYEIASLAALANLVDLLEGYVTGG